MKIRTMAIGIGWMAAVSGFAEHGFIRDNDKNGDQRLSWEEVEPTGWSRKMFDIKDMDKDRLLSENDLWAHNRWMDKPAQNAVIIKAMDANNDGVIQKSEWWWGDPEWNEYDKNGDANLDKTEIASMPKPKDVQEVLKRMLPDEMWHFKGRISGKIVSVTTDGMEAVIQIAKVESAKDNQAKNPQAGVGREVTVNPQWKEVKKDDWQPVAAQVKKIKNLKAGQTVTLSVENDEGDRLHLIK